MSSRALSGGTRWQSWLSPSEAPLRSLALIFLAWKSLLLLLAVAAPGPGYDTSSLILYTNTVLPEQRHVQFHSLGMLDRLALRLFRWDAIYFVETAQRGYLYEQEWAFSWAYTRVLAVIGPYLVSYPATTLQCYIWAGFIASNVCHLLSVFVLYHLVIAVSNYQQNSRIPFLSAVLHILSPAGMFLTAPYTEAAFSFLNFSGMLFYALSKSTPNSSESSRTVLQDFHLLSSGIAFSLSTLIRSNGLLNGLIYLYDIALVLPSLLRFDFDFNLFRTVSVTSVAGVLIAIGFIGPQPLAYREFCLKREDSLEIRPWCDKFLPSIYSWVQSNYWNVGFLRYWNISNLPLFLLSAPMLWLLFHSSATAFSGLFGLRPKRDSVAGLEYTRFPQLALPQLILAATALTSYHVQIINRISSGYPIWYMVIANWLTVGRTSGRKNSIEALCSGAIRWMIIYAIVQGILFAEFLPPA